MKELRNNYFVLSIILNKFITFIHFYIFINSGDFAINFININFVILYYYFFIETEEFFTLNIINNYIIKSSALTHYIKLIIRISYYTKKYIYFFN